MRYLLLIFCVACGIRGGRPETPSHPNRPEATCAGTDIPVTTSAQCEGSGSCYQLPNGNWCTSTRTNWD